MPTTMMDDDIFKRRAVKGLGGHTSPLSRPLPTGIGEPSPVTPLQPISVTDKWAETPLETVPAATPGLMDKLGIAAERLGVRAGMAGRGAYNIAQGLGTAGIQAGRGTIEALQDPKVIAALGQFGASLSTPGSVGQQLGQTATQMAQSNMYAKALSEVMAGREPDLTGLTTEQQELVSRTRERVETRKAKEEETRIKREQGEVYGKTLESIRKGQEFDLAGLSPEQKKSALEEWRETAKFKERETAQEARTKDFEAKLKFEMDKATLGLGEGEAPEVKRAYSFIQRVAAKFDPAQMLDTEGKISFSRVLDVISKGGEVMTDVEKRLLYEHLKVLEKHRVNTLGLSSSQFKPSRASSGVILEGLPD